MTEAQIQLQNALTTTFLANLAFLSEYDNELYHRVDELSRMIENGTYKEKYALDFIMEDGDFDIYDIVNDKYLYDKKPKKFNNKLISEVQFDEKNSIFNLSEYFTFEEEITIDRENRFNFEKLEQLYNLSRNDMFFYSVTLKNFLKIKKKRLKKLNKIIFLGTLLGRHIPKISQKINGAEYLVLERNLEIFRLSLFVVDYSILAQHGVVFSVMDVTENEEYKINKFLNSNYLNNYLIKVSTTEINISRYLDLILSSLVSQQPTIYDYNRKLYVLINRSTKILKNKYKILSLNRINKEFNFFDNIPILFVAAGPSLDENINWIKENQSKFFIVTIGAAYKKLLDNNIKINIITTLDEQYDILNDKQFDDKSLSKLSKNTIIIASSITNEKILQKFNRENLFLYEVAITFKSENIPLSGYSVGELTLDILLKMNAKRIFLIGLDMSLNPKTGLTHSKASDSGISKYDLNNEDDRKSFGLRNGLIKVKGNLLKEVNTTSLFYSSIKYLEKILSNNESEIYNLSSSGAFFQNTIPTDICELNTTSFLDVSSKKNNFDILLNKYSFMNLEKEDKMKLVDKIDYLNKTLFEEIENFTLKEYKNYDIFFDEIIKFKNILYKDNILYWILENYLNILLPFLSFHFNDVKVKNEDKQINLIKAIFVKQVKTILDDYKFCLERILE